MIEAIFRPFQTRIQLRYITYLVLLIVLIVAATMYQVVPEWRAEIRDNANLSEQAAIERDRAAIEQFVASPDEDIRLLAALPSIEQLARVAITPSINTDSALFAAAREPVEQDFVALAQARNIYYQVRFINSTGTVLVRVDSDGTNTTVQSSQNLASVGGRDFFVNTADEAPGGVYVSPLVLNREGRAVIIEGSLANDTHVPVLRYGAPVYVLDSTDREVLAGIVVTDVYMKPMLNLLVDERDRHAYLVNEDGYYLVNTVEPDHTFGFEAGIDFIGGVAGARVQDDFAENITVRFTAPVGVEEFTEGDNLFHLTRIVIPDADYTWTLVRTRDESVALARVDDATNAVLATSALVTLFAVMAGVFAIRQITTPISSIAETAAKVADGDLNQRVAYDVRPDEIGTLANSFNSMTQQLNQLVNTLEDRVAAATARLEALVDMNIQTATILNTTRLLEAAVNLMKERFGLYHAHVYLLHDEQLALTAGAGYVGRQMVERKHSIALNSPRSIVARAAREGVTIIENDTTASSDFLRNALLPDTAAEASIPIVSRGQLLGVLDIQSDRVGEFDEAYLSIVEIFASQLGNAITNAQLYETTARNSRHEQALNRIGAIIQQGTTVDEVLQTAVKELGKALRVPLTAIEVQIEDQSNGHS